MPGSRGTMGRVVVALCSDKGTKGLSCSSRLEGLGWHHCVNQDLLLLVRLECLCWAVPALHIRAQQSRVEGDREAFLQIFRRWWQNRRFASVVDLRITTKKECSWC